MINYVDKHCFCNCLLHKLNVLSIGIVINLQFVNISFKYNQILKNPVRTFALDWICRPFCYIILKIVICV